MLNFLDSEREVKFMPETQLFITAIASQGSWVIKHMQLVHN